MSMILSNAFRVNVLLHASVTHFFFFSCISILFEFRHQFIRRCRNLGKVRVINDVFFPVYFVIHSINRHFRLKVVSGTSHEWLANVEYCEWIEQIEVIFFLVQIRNSCLITFLIVKRQKTHQTRHKNVCSSCNITFKSLINNDLHWTSLIYIGFIRTSTSEKHRPVFVYLHEISLFRYSSTEKQGISYTWYTRNEPVCLVGDCGTVIFA